VDHTVKPTATERSAMTDSPRDGRLPRTLETLRAAGYRLQDATGGPDQRALATPGPEAAPVGGAVTDLAVEAPAAPDPLGVVTAVADARRHDRRVLFSVDEAGARTVREVLAPPVGARETDDGRAFYPVEDRIRLAEDGFAMVAVDSLRPTFEWYEEPVEEADAPAGRTGTDRRRLVLDVDGRPTVVLDAVEALACPPAEAFPLRYERGDDGRFRVHEGDRVVGLFSGVAAMRDRGLEPVPEPLIPEFHLDASPTGDWLVAVDGRVEPGA
jgi:hypothetical protein